MNDDIRDPEALREFNSIEILAEALPDRVGSLLSLKSLSEDLQVSPHTVSHWVDILEKVYYCYRIAPFGAPQIRALKKEQKLFLWDWSAVDKEGARFENLVASHLFVQTYSLFSRSNKYSVFLSSPSGCERLHGD